ncbi:MAG: hypothetical protein HY784_00645 [Chloroflexi bacterium]|nr:hypothetical protein [Chloroflexota bacterium]
MRTNSEAFVGAFSRSGKDDHSKGLAITSVIRADSHTQIEPVRFAEDSSLVFRLLSAPLIEGGGGFLRRLGKTILAILRQPVDFIDAKFIPGLMRRGPALMIMQTEDNQMRLRLGRDLFTLFRRGLVATHDPQRTIPVDIELGHRVARLFASKIGGHPSGTVTEGLLDVPTTAHMLGGCTFGRDPSEGVTDVNGEVFNYPGLYVVDGSIVPANPGINPSLTITALAEYVMSRIPSPSPSYTPPARPASQTPRPPSSTAGSISAVDPR